MLDKQSKVILILIVIFYLALSATPCRAQVMCDPHTFPLNKILGEVVSNGPKGVEPIGEAKVELFRTGREDEDDILVASTKSDANGFFEVGNTKKGLYRLEVSKYESGFMRFYSQIKVGKKSKDAEKVKRLRIRLGVSQVDKEGCGEAVLIDD